MLKKIKENISSPCGSLATGRWAELDKYVNACAVAATEHIARLGVSYQKVCKGFWAVDQAVGADNLTLLLSAILRIRCK